MRIKHTITKWIRIVFCIVVGVFLVFFCNRQTQETEHIKENATEQISDFMEQKLLSMHLPVFCATQTDVDLTDFAGLFMEGRIPILQNLLSGRKISVETESPLTTQELIRLEGQDEDLDNGSGESSDGDSDEESDEGSDGDSDEDSDEDSNNDVDENTDGDEWKCEVDADGQSDGIITLNPDLADKMKTENDQSIQKSTIVSEEFVKATQKIQGYQWDVYQDRTKLIQDFYAIDQNTEISDEMLDVKKFLQKDMRLKGTAENPQILIYHTHSQEAFADSQEGDQSTTIMGAGEYLATLLREEYGLNVLHHTGQYDIKSRDYAYSTALPNIEQVLKENPSIEVVIDLHRDGISEDRKLVTQVNGKQCAQFMLFNGLSHTKALGDIEYLNNPYIEDNLAFSFQLQTLCNEYYPGVTRKIYLKGYRYNMHLCKKSLLIELGAQTNTVSEVHNTLDIIAHVLSMELTGKDACGKELSY